MKRDGLSSFIHYKVLRRGTDLENVRFETEDEEEATQRAHPVRIEIVRDADDYYCCCCCCRLLVYLCGLLEGNNRNESGRRGKIAGSTLNRRIEKIEAGVNGIVGQLSQLSNMYLEAKR